MNNTQYQNVNFRMNKDVKKQFDNILFEIGLNPSTAFNMFARLVIREKGLPFPITVKNEGEIIDEAREALNDIRREAEKNGTSELSMDKINAEIALYRKEKRERGGK